MSSGVARALGGTGTARPRLRGVSHLVAAPVWAVLTVALLLAARGHPGRQLALLLYGAASVWLFLVSGLYHSITWSPPRRSALRRLDHANIFLLVAATYTPVTVTILEGAWRTAMLVTVWGLAAAGMTAAGSPVAFPRWLLASLYLVMGWVAVVALPVITNAVGAGGLLLLLSAGALYSTGAVVYALRRPRLHPVWFGYHELFHVLVIAANALFCAFMAVEVVHH